MKQLFDPLFTTYCLIWCVMHVFRYAGRPVPFLNGYLTDFVAVPAIAHLALTFTRRFIIPGKPYHYPAGYLLFIALYTSVVLEWLLPRFSASYTGDWGDVAAYFAGSCFYFFVHGRRGMKDKACGPR